MGRSTSQAAAACAILVVGALLAASYGRAGAGEADAVAHAAFAARGEGVYQKHCASCHGLDGDGKGRAARYLDPTPRDFTRGVYKFRTTPTGTPPTDADLIRTVKKGVGATSMPAWERRLTDMDTKAVVAYIKSLSPETFAEEIDPEEILVVPEPPAPTPASLTKGKVMFMLMKCWECHGTDGRGGGPAAHTLRDDLDRPIKPLDFTGGKYKGGSSPKDVYRTFSTGLAGTPMPSYVEALLLGKEALADISSIKNTFPEEDVKLVVAFAATLPTFEELYSKEEAEQKAIMDENRWALVHYVKSLTRKRNPLHYLFTDPAGRLDEPLYRGIKTKPKKEKKDKKKKKKKKDEAGSS